MPTAVAGFGQNLSNGLNEPQPKAHSIWVWVNTYRYIFSGVNIHLPAILGFTRYQGFDPSPYVIQCMMHLRVNASIQWFFTLISQKSPGNLVWAVPLRLKLLHS